MRRGEDGALSPGFLAFMVAAITGILFFMQMGHASVLATESRTAADAAALAAADSLRYRLGGLEVGSTWRALNDSVACGAARDYAARNGAKVETCVVDRDSLLRPQYAVEVTVEGLTGPQGPSDDIGEQRPQATSRAEVELTLAPISFDDPYSVSYGLRIIGDEPVLAPVGGSDRWKGAGGWDEWIFGVIGGDPSISGPSAQGFSWPMCGYPATSEFGPRWGRLHGGIDIGAPLGAPIGAAKAGRVSFVGWDADGYGNWVIVDHGGGMTTRYAHMSTGTVAVSVGDMVEAGDLIGGIGSTGRSTGPHLHFEVRSGALPLNPRSVLGPPC